MGWKVLKGAAMKSKEERMERNERGAGNVTSLPETGAVGPTTR